MWQKGNKLDHLDNQPEMLIIYSAMELAVHLEGTPGLCVLFSSGPIESKTPWQPQITPATKSASDRRWSVTRREEALLKFTAWHIKCSGFKGDDGKDGDERCTPGFQPTF